MEIFGCAEGTALALARHCFNERGQIASTVHTAQCRISYARLDGPLPRPAVIRPAGRRTITMPELRIYFSDFFDASPASMRSYGAFDVSLINDLPMFIDPFLLFNSEKPEYRTLHNEMIKYLKFLRDKAISSELDAGGMYSWFVFKEVRQNWLGFSLSGNRGHGLGPKFAKALHGNFNNTFKNFGEEKVPESPHFEKLTLFDTGVGKDNVSDFTTNLIKKYLLEYTEEFARQHIRRELTDDFAVQRAYFNYGTETWASKTYRLPAFMGDFVLLTPQDLLTKDDLWINQRDLVGDYNEIVDSIHNVQLRAEINNYFDRELSIILERKERKRQEAAEKKRKKQAGGRFDFVVRLSRAKRTAEPSDGKQSINFLKLLTTISLSRNNTGTMLLSSAAKMSARSKQNLSNRSKRLSVYLKSIRNSIQSQQTAMRPR